MKPLFTVHAGEYLVGSHIEQHYPQWSVWVPSKDTGIDLLITNAKNRKVVTLQVKFSKDFTPTNRPDFLRKKLIASGWWTHNRQKIQNSPADLWVLVLPSFTEQTTSFIIIPPRELFRRLRRIHGAAWKRTHSYLWVTATRRCWEGRGLARSDQELLAIDHFTNSARDFTSFLDAWPLIGARLK